MLNFRYLSFLFDRLEEDMDILCYGLRPYELYTSIVLCAVRDDYLVGLVNFGLVNFGHIEEVVFFPKHPL